MLNNFTPTEKTSQILLDQYKIFVESAQKISDNRIAAVNYYIAILTGLLVAITAFFENVIVKTILCTLGIIIAAVACLTIVRYKNMNKVKFELIHELEELLPAAPYREELARIRKCRIPSFSQLETALFCLFGLAFVGLLFISPCITEILGS